MNKKLYLSAGGLGNKILLKISSLMMTKIYGKLYLFSAYNISMCTLAMDNGFDIQTKCIHDQNEENKNSNNMS